MKLFYRDGIKQSFDWITWNDAAIKDLQDAMNNAKKNREYCTTDVSNLVLLMIATINDERSFSSMQGAFPTGNKGIPLRTKFTADCSYVAVDKCSNSQPPSCCERLG